MKFCPVVPEICRGQVHGPRKERRRIIIIKNKNKNNNKKRSKNKKSPKLCLEDLISSSLLQALLMLSRVKSMLSCMKSDICFWKWGFEKVFWNFISEVSSHIYCLGNGISVDVLTDSRILYLDWIPQDNLQWESVKVEIKLAMLKRGISKSNGLDTIT